MSKTNSYNPDRNEPWKLIPLTPEYLESEHSVYAKEISAALKNSKIRNIALSGNYGVGKSSILQQVAAQHKKRVVELSLSTLVVHAVNSVTLSLRHRPQCCVEKA